MRTLRIAMLACLLLSAAVAAAQGTCSTAMLQGTYVMEHTGLIFMGVNAPYSLLGVLKADADGNVVIQSIQVNPFGTVPSPTPPPINTWTATSDCKVTLTHAGGGAISEGMAVRNGEEIWLMFTAPLKRMVPGSPTPLPAVGSGVLRRMSPGGNDVRNCSTAMLRGTYAQSCSGYIPVASPFTGVPMVFMPFRMSLMMVSSGTGTFGGSGKMVMNGQVTSIEYKDGVNQVDEDCRASATFQVTDPSLPGTWQEKMVVFDEGKQMLSTTISPTGQVDMCRFVRIDR